MAKSIMIQGTMSNVGKSVLAGGLLRVLKQDGIKAVPFKSQNMSLNSFITKEGLEIGRAQAMQAEAAGVRPSVLMNPILLKPTSDTGSQVIVNGEVAGVMGAAEYYRRKTDYIPDILDAYGKLARENDVIVIEGAGSPAEINLKENDIVNMGMAEMADAPVLLAGDIDRGGVFAQIAGTIALLEEHERKRVKGTIINKFRGDKEILRPGLSMLEEKVKIPVCGVVPYFHLDIDEEDSLTEKFSKKPRKGLLDLAVIRLPRIANFTDFAALECIPEVSLRYVDAPGAFGDPDAVLIPGSKNTIGDLMWMRENGLEARVLRHAGRGKLVFGICGGYQMLGESIQDPDGAEGGGAARGMGLLPIRTFFEGRKERALVTGRFSGLRGMLRGLEGAEAWGYEIHMGRTEVLAEDAAILDIHSEGRGEHPDGAQNGNVYGCYIHGIFDYPGVAKGFAEAIMKEKGMDPGSLKAIDMKQYKETQYDALADIIRENLDMERIYDIIEKGNRALCI